MCYKMNIAIGLDWRVGGISMDDNVVGAGWGGSWGCVENMGV